MKLRIENAKVLNPDLNPELFLPSPRDVLKAIEEGLVKDMNGMKKWQKKCGRN